MSRRAVLRGAGGLAISLPSLSAMLGPGRSQAQPVTPKRLLVFYTPGGTLLDKWRPLAGTGLRFGPMLSPLNAVASKLTVIDGLALSVTELGHGHPHSRGMGALLTGMPLASGGFVTNGGNAGFATGISVDQRIAEKISSGLRFKSLEVASGWALGFSGGAAHPADILSYSAPGVPIAPLADPAVVFRRLFGGIGRNVPVSQTPKWNQSILDAVTDEYRRVSKRLGSEDRARLESHLQMVESTRRRLAASVAAGCTAPVGIDLRPGFYEDGLAVEQDTQGNATTGLRVPLKGAAMTDLVVSALACDLTRVATIQWGDSEAKFGMGFLSDGEGKPLADHHHGYQHDRGFQPAALEVIHHWYAERFAELLGKLEATKEVDGTSLLDHTLVLWVSEIQMPETHAQDHMPFMLAGGSQVGLPMGRYVKVPEQPHANLLVSLLQHFGLPDERFGHAEHCTGPLAGL